MNLLPYFYLLFVTVFKMLTIMQLTIYFFIFNKMENYYYL